MRLRARRGGPLFGSWRVRAVLAVSLLVLWLAGPSAVSLLAQAPIARPANADSFPACIQAQVTARVAALPPADQRNFFQDPDTLLNAVWICAGWYADLQIVPIGQAMLGGLVVIMIIWTGVGFMFSGEFDLGSLLGTLFLAGFGFIVLDNYFYANPAVVPWSSGTSNGFVALIANQSVVWGDLILGDAEEQFNRAFVEARVSAEDNIMGGAARTAADPDRIYTEALSNPDAGGDEAVGGFFRWLNFQARVMAMGVMKFILSILLWLIGWMIYAQYVWGFFTLTVLTVVGPLFVPFMMITQLDFLFWGWFKGLINGVIYMLTASAMYAVAAMVLIVPLQRFALLPIPGDPGSFLGLLELQVRMFAEYLPLVVMSLFAALKVNAVSGMIVAGGTPPGSGIGSALTKGASAAATLAGRFGGPALGSPVPLSQATPGGRTPRQRAGGAYQDARQRAGAPPRPRPGASSGGSAGSSRSSRPGA